MKITRSAKKSMISIIDRLTKVSLFGYVIRTTGLYEHILSSFDIRRGVSVEIIRMPRIMKDTSKGHILHSRSVGFVPTMGSLHEGHLGLVRMAREENDITVVSIYVNPAQFGPSEDLSRYPRDLEGDTGSLRKEGVDILFLPDDAHMYPRGFCTHVDVSGLSEKLCGAFRPGHFRGVATVVTKLFNIVSPTRSYFGQKDYQQALIIKKLVKDLDMTGEVVVCPTARQEDGLALSSRNRYLAKGERDAASVIFKSLKKASEAVKSGIINATSIKEIMLDTLKSEPCVSEIQYCSVYDPETLDEMQRIDREALLAVALKVGNTRLIDNILVDPGK